MCHWILLLPLIGLPIFWLTPLNLATPIYIIIVVASGLMYWAIAKSMGKQPEVGAESLIGVEAEVVSKLEAIAHAQYLVRSRGELWSANCAEALKPGEKVHVAGVDGIKLQLTRNGFILKE